MRFSGASGGRRNRVLIFLSLSLLLLGLLSLPTSAVPTSSPSLVVGNTYTVNTTADDDDGSCEPLPSGDCALREAINLANADGTPSIIEFNIPISGPGCNGVTCTITLASALPSISVDLTTIDGTTQAANQGNTNPYGPEIEISGDTAPAGTTCFALADGTAHTTIKGLVIRCPSQGLRIEGDDNTIIGNYIGTDATGTAAVGSSTGIYVNDGANNTIGGPTESDRNLISGNGYGIALWGSTTAGNVIQGNYIGTDRTGVQPLGNTYNGMSISNGAHDNTVGPNNVIAYNGSIGVSVSGAGSTGNTITQNSIHSNGSAGINIYSGGNNDLASPSLTFASCSSVGGSTHLAWPNVTVEVFSDGDGQGRSYEEGSFEWAPDGLSFTFYPDSGWLPGPMLTATVTDLSTGDTSEFSAPVSSGCPLTFLPLIMKNYEP